MGRIHGSLSKAGKVRKLTPKVPARPRRRVVPRIRNRINYRKRVILGRPPGQPS